ncbi:peptidase A4 family-domain-containing protein [Biscogniauxia sp. FL1348]|nr:peptidase A4 family-domain-containing protein [Biscogniauxia sp. FL1348]
MRLSQFIAASIGITTVVASPTTGYLTDGITLTPRRLDTKRLRTTRPPSSSSSVEHSLAEGSDSHIEYEDNWAGAVLIGSGYETVTGTFTVPTPGVPPGGSSSTEYVVSAWVGIDGDTCQQAIWQAGVDSYIHHGSVTYGTWYEWYPEDSYYYSGFDVSGGDSIKVTIAAISTTSGNVTIENLTTSKSVSHTLTGLPTSESLCQVNAEWIVEALDPVEDFASFGTITFTDAYATTSSGAKVGPSGSDIFDIKQSDKILTDCSIGESSVTCTYV